MFSVRSIAYKFTGNARSVIISSFDDNTVIGLLLVVEQLAISHSHFASVEIDSELVQAFKSLIRDHVVYGPVSSFI